jgi:pantoate--beta-alanine ligase
MPSHGPHGIALAETVDALRKQVTAWKREGVRVALVPTMGALHAGHVSLVKMARRRGAKVIASIFVNPAQFAPTEDFSKYPRTFDADCAKLVEASADMVYAPDAGEIYPEGFATTIMLGGPAKAGLEDRFRPTHFDGVATVVAKLLTQCRPDTAIFGDKDYQQLLVIKQMARDLDLDVTIAGAPTVREKDGLALSSRNIYLSAADRAAAVLLPDTLKSAASEVRAGGNITDVEVRAVAALAASGFVVDYVAVRHAATLGPATGLAGGPLRVLAAAKLGNTRLIDNMQV